MGPFDQIAHHLGQLDRVLGEGEELLYAGLVRRRPPNQDDAAGRSSWWTAIATNRRLILHSSEPPVSEAKDREDGPVSRGSPPSPQCMIWRYSSLRRVTTGDVEGAAGSRWMLLVPTIEPEAFRCLEIDDVVDGQTQYELPADVSDPEHRRFVREYPDWLAKHVYMLARERPFPSVPSELALAGVKAEGDKGYFSLTRAPSPSIDWIRLVLVTFLAAAMLAAPIPVLCSTMVLVFGFFSWLRCMSTASKRALSRLCLRPRRTLVLDRRASSAGSELEVSVDGRRASALGAPRRIVISRTAIGLHYDVHTRRAWIEPARSYLWLVFERGAVLVDERDEALDSLAAMVWLAVGEGVSISLRRHHGGRGFWSGLLSSIQLAALGVVAFLTISHHGTNVPVVGIGLLLGWEALMGPLYTRVIAEHLERQLEAALGTRLGRPAVARD